ncbi:hypothetical protein [Caballeronia sp. ATUFL_F1_KS4A]|uniref:hypothetical protein n=1 Tax=Caballeronia sp. ATUFL_F1_KS4A TaxID=2921768 RepID=UPI00202934B2|nr:hypothetical protein [Caballeronia sp. ATUFL_F1_KS4A]
MTTDQECQKVSVAGMVRLQTLAVLNSCGYIDDKTALRVLESMDQMSEIDLRFDSARAMLDWLIQEGFLDEQAAEAAAVRFVETLETDKAPEDLLQYESVVGQIDPRFRAPFAAFAARTRKKVKRRMIGYASAFCVIFAAVGAYTLWSASTPSCAATSTKDALFRIGVQSKTDLATKRPGLSLNDDRDLTPRFSDFQEVGYDDGDRSRGCTAVIKAGEATSPIGYVIRPREKNGEFEVHTYPYEYVAARYNEAGLNKALGAPLGRDAIRAAVIAGIKGIDDRVGRRSPSHHKPVYGEDVPRTMEARVIGVLPAADCRRIDDHSYACPVLVDYKDDLLSVIGAMPYVQLKGEFVFERDRDAWKVANGFDDKFLNTLVNGRVRNTLGADAAQKMQQSMESRPSAP